MKDKSENQCNMTAVVLAGSRDFGRCRFSSRWLTALWPLGGRSVIENLLEHLREQGVGQAVICSNDEGNQLQDSITAVNGMKLDFVHEILPMGTAGSVRRAVQGGSQSTTLVVHAGLISPPNIAELLDEHRRAKSDLTVVLNPQVDGNEAESEAAGIYLCEPSVIELVPKESYCDIKETLIPLLLKAGKKVSGVRLERAAGSFRDWAGYMIALADYLGNANEAAIDLPVKKSLDSENIWISPEAQLHETARVYGPVVVMEGAVIAAGAVIFGPAVVGRNVSIGKGSLVAESVLWDDAEVGVGCEIQGCLMDYCARIGDSMTMEGQAVANIGNSILSRFTNKTTRGEVNNEYATQITLQSGEEKFENTSNRYGNKKIISSPLAGFGLAAVLIAFIWSYWPTIAGLWKVWMRSDEYSIGLLVPFLAVYIAWTRRQEFGRCFIRPSAWGLTLFLIAQGLRYFGLLFMYGSAEGLSLILSVSALILLMFGGGTLRKSVTILLFLCLMLPLPKRIETKITIPLQKWATSSAVFSLETLGYEITTEGNVIHLGDTTVAVAEACNGLRMVTSFFVIIGLVVLLVNRRWWEKFILLLSAFPIALLCNTVRLAITAIAFTILSGEFWEDMFHDFGGYAMMPLALVMVVLELWILEKLFMSPDDTQKGEILVTAKI